MADGKNDIFDFTKFLKGDRDPEYEETDRSGLTDEHFRDCGCQRKVLPLYYFLTRLKGSSMTVAQMKKRFNCGAKLISDVRKAVVEKKPLRLPGRTKKKPVRDNAILVGLVDSMTRENGMVSDSDLANILGTSRMSVNRVRHDLQFTYKALRHGPVLSQRHVGMRLAFCQIRQNDDWSKTLFTDESRFSTSPDCPIMQWVKRGDHIYVETDKFPFSMMVWGGIVGNQKTS